MPKARSNQRAHSTARTYENSYCPRTRSGMRNRPTTCFSIAFRPRMKRRRTWRIGIAHRSNGRPIISARKRVRKSPADSGADHATRLEIGEFGILCESPQAGPVSVCLHASHVHLFPAPMHSMASISTRIPAQRGFATRPAWSKENPREKLLSRAPYFCVLFDI